MKKTINTRITTILRCSMLPDAGMSHGKCRKIRAFISPLSLRKNKTENRRISPHGSGNDLAVSF